MRSPARTFTAMLIAGLTTISVVGVATPSFADAPPTNVDPLDLPARIGDSLASELNGFVSSSGDTAATGTVVSINGSGWGHGIGLSQYGSQARALDGMTSTDIVQSYYTNASVGSFGVGPIPTPDNIFTNVGSDLTSTKLTVSAGPVGPSSGMVVTRLTGSTPQVVTLFRGDTMVITDTTPAARNPGGCKATITIGNVVSNWNVGSCDIDVALTSGADTPTDLVTATNCRTSNCTFGYGVALHLVDNESSQRTVSDPFPGFDLVVESTMDEYTRGILEVPFSWSMAALEAQAIAARSYGATFVVSKDHTKQGCFCDVKNTSSYQVYGGWIGNREKADRWDQAARNTSSQVITDPAAPHSGIVRAFYTSSNGGASQNNEDLWGGQPFPYLRSVDDPYSLTGSNPLAAWREDIPIELFSSKLGFDLVTDLTIVNRFDSGTPKVIEVTGFEGGDFITRCFGKYEPCVSANNVEIGNGAGEIFDKLFGLFSSHINSIVIPGDPAAITRLWGQDRYATAAAVSKDEFDRGVGTVYIATGTNFPDALAAAPLAVADRGPVLLVRRDSIPSATSAEIARLNPGKIVVLGGTSAISSSVAATLANYAPVSRIAGADRYSTAADIARHAFPGQVGTVFVAVGTSFPDALVAAPAAAAVGAPVVLVTPTSIPEPTRTVLKEMKPGKIVVVGGGTTIGQSVLDQLDSLASNEVIAIAGSDRYTTSALVSQYAHGNGADAVFIATGLAFPDALTAGVVAGLRNAPVLLVTSNSVPGAVATELFSLDPASVVILGGTDAVSDGVKHTVMELVG